MPTELWRIFFFVRRVKLKNRRHLVKNGLIPPRTRLSNEEKEAIESLSPDEVKALISVDEKFRERLGEAGFSRDRPPISILHHQPPD